MCERAQSKKRRLSGVWDLMGDDGNNGGRGFEETAEPTWNGMKQGNLASGQGILAPAKPSVLCGDRKK